MFKSLEFRVTVALHSQTFKWDVPSSVHTGSRWWSRCSVDTAVVSEGMRVVSYEAKGIEWSHYSVVKALISPNYPCVCVAVWVIMCSRWTQSALDCLTLRWKTGVTQELHLGSVQVRAKCNTETSARWFMWKQAQALCVHLLLLLLGTVKWNGSDRCYDL